MVALSGARFGSVAWQTEMVGRVVKKLEAGQELDSFEQTFLECQSEWTKRMLSKIPKGGCNGKSA